jgi:putative oxidoreductase
MLVAIVSTKIPILLGHEFWIFHLSKSRRYGSRGAAHQRHGSMVD